MDPRLFFFLSRAKRAARLPAREKREPVDEASTTLYCCVRVCMHACVCGVMENHKKIIIVLFSLKPNTRTGYSRVTDLKGWKAQVGLGLVAKLEQGSS